MGAWDAATLEGLDDGHAAAAAWARIGESGRFSENMGICLVGLSLRGRRVEQLPCSGEVYATVSSGEEAVVADAMEAPRQDVDEETADELIGRKGHDLLPIAAFGAVVFPFEGHAGIVEGDQPTVGDCHAVSVA